PYAGASTAQRITHPDISLVLAKTDLSSLPQVAAVSAEDMQAGDEQVGARMATDLRGRKVLTSHQTIDALGWSVFVEQPLEEAFAPLSWTLLRTGLLLLVGVLMSGLASLILARRMVRPIHALQAGAARIGAGALDK